MLKEPLFKIVSLAHKENSVNAVLEIDQLNEIFNGHFPDQPVVPGACMLQIVKEVIATAINTSVRLVKADNIKFLSLVQPAAVSLQLVITYNLTETELKVNANLSSGDLICMKLQATFVNA
jgi:3-hydroxyacyl-[acyl-carrier-protein] dehydratase